MDEDKIEAFFKEILNEIGIEEDSEVFKNTPKRIARSYKEIFAGMDDGNEPRITLFKNQGYNDILSVKDIPFYSMCEHHLLPFFGTVSIAYIPGNRTNGKTKGSSYRLIKENPFKRWREREETRNKRGKQGNKRRST